MTTLFCRLNVEEFNRVSLCCKAKEIWETLEVTHDCTNQVKESKVNIIFHKYELFKINEIETIFEMTRDLLTLNSFKALGRDITNFELLNKILLSLPRSWESKVTSILETKHLTILKLEQLIGSIITHEMFTSNDDKK